MASEAPLTCPVCLDAPPEAPQVTLCGHAFCFPCIARHAATNRRSDTGEPAKCPMCFAPTRLADLRGVRRRPVEAIRAADRSRGRGAGEGDAPGEKKNDEESVVKMSLVRRHRASSVPRRAEAYRAEAELAGEAAAWPRSVRARDGGACDRFAKYTLTGEEAAFAEEELATLEAKAARMAEEGGSENENQLPFVLLACDVVQNRARAWGERRAEREGREAPPIAPSRRDAVAAKAARAAERAAETRAADAAFPALLRSAGEGAAANNHNRAPAFLMGRAVQAASAFSEEEEEEEDEDEDEDEDEGFRKEEEVLSKISADDERLAREDETGGADPSGTKRTNRAAAAAVASNDPSATNDPSASNDSSSASNDSYWFYQSSDGQPVVLHSACLRTLLAHFGAYENLPATIEAPALELEHRVQDADSRRRAAHLRHLPLTTAYVVAELDLAPVVGEAALEKHGEELRRRAELRRKKMDADLRREARREAAETARRRSERVFSKPHRDAMPTIRVDGEGGSGQGASPARELAERTANLRLEDGANANANANANAADADADADSLSPADLLAMARRAAAEEAAAAAAESAAAREALANAAGPRGTSFARVARWGFASGLDAPKILGDVDSDAFGPRLGGEGGDRAAVVVGGGGGGAWGAAAAAGRRRRAGGRRPGAARRRVGSSRAPPGR